MKLTTLPTNHLHQMLTNYWNHIAAVFTAIGQYLNFKLLATVPIVIYQFMFDINHESSMLILAVLIVLDSITGVAAARDRGECIESKKFIKSAFKLGIYGLLVSASFLTDQLVGLTGAFIEIDKFMLGFLAATELISIIENTGAMGYAIPKGILDFLQKYTEKSVTTHTTSKEVSDDPNIQDINITTDTSTTHSTTDNVQTTDTHTTSKEVVMIKT